MATVSTKAAVPDTPSAPRLAKRDRNTLSVKWPVGIKTLFEVNLKIFIVQRNFLVFQSVKRMPANSVMHLNLLVLVSLYYSVLRQINE